jgi:hypothetical protein
LIERLAKGGIDGGMLALLGNVGAAIAVIDAVQQGRRVSRRSRTFEARRGRARDRIAARGAAQRIRQISPVGT